MSRPERRSDRSTQGRQPPPASHPARAAASVSRQARTDSPASSSRLRSRTAATTCVESVRCLPPAPNRPSPTTRGCPARVVEAGDRGRQAERRHRGEPTGACRASERLAGGVHLRITSWLGSWFLTRPVPRVDVPETHGAGVPSAAVPMKRMDRPQFFSRLAALDEERLKKALWNLYWRGSAAMRERIEAELDPRPNPAERRAKESVLPEQALTEVRDFVALARSGAYLGGDRRVSPRERTRWRFTFQRLVGDATAALYAENMGDAAAAMEQLVDLSCQMRDRDYFRSDDPVEAARFVVSDAVALLWSRLREQYGFSGFAERAAPQLIRWESRYGWTRRGDGSVSETEVSLADVLARMLPALDAWIGFADYYLDALDRFATPGRVRAAARLAAR